MSVRGGGGNSFKAIQDSAMEIYRNFVPALRRCSSSRHNAAGWTPGLAERRASHQQAENLKWQQDMFLRLVNMKGLFQEGLVSESDVASFRQKILDNIDVCYDGGEYPQVTRDKLLFLQELLYARCISEEEYHGVKKSLLYRLAAQGAEINASDIVLSCSAATASAPTSPVRSRMKNAESTGDDPREKLKDEAMQRVAKSKSPVKHLFEAMTRRKHSGKNNERRVPHALDFIRPRDCPARDPPEFDTSDQCGSPLFHSPSGSVSTMESSSKAVEVCSKKNGFFSTVGNSPKAPASAEACSKKNGLFSTIESSPKAPASAEACSKKNGFFSTIESSPKAAESCSQKNGFFSTMESSPKAPASAKACSKNGFVSTTMESPSKAPASAEASSKKNGFFSAMESSPKPPVEACSKMSKIESPAKAPASTEACSKKNGFASTLECPYKAATPVEASSKKKFQAKGVSTDFYIDKVLGENIKKELEHIRSEINRTSSTQTFTNDQIDAIATRLPTDKSELMRFFPKSWCDRYGDVVLDVVHKEFKGHVKDMEAARKNAKEKRRAENDENSGGFCENGATTFPSKPSSKQATLIKSSKSSVNTRCFTTTDESSPRRAAAKKVTSFNASVERYEKELDGKLCAEIEKLPHRKTPLRV
ncbi:neurofilament heavy polypeptide [Selaginella moellendorffii]|uniref:neurofilament heavy polypeptide n=1 Tax=Selaginella moellendorffii TaxID=88036 RepID=UPI000D1C7A37|nr:neurofilament heavy polypeptide [Selaginella moellendorffii]|eukprot:XP_024537707.1 neurofilament heavy polypeptide [Selaginella moellendorffii]